VLDAGEAWLVSTIAGAAALKAVISSRTAHIQIS
jgi:hypothetical protein